MFLVNEERIEVGRKHLSKIKLMLESKKKLQTMEQKENAAQEAFDQSPPHMRKTICFHAGLKTRHVEMKFSELTYAERKQVVAALNSLIDLVDSLPRFISEDDCALNTSH